MNQLHRVFGAVEPVVTTAIGFVAAALAGRAVSPITEAFTVLWPCNALVLGLILVRSDRSAFGTLLGAAIGCIAFNLTHGMGTSLSVGLAFANVTEIALAAVLLGRLRRVVRLDSLDDLSRLLIATVVSASVSTLIAMAVLAMADASPTFETAQRWWIASVVASMLLVPAILTARPGAWRDNGGGHGVGIAGKLIESVVLCASIAALSTAAIDMHDTAMVAFLTAPLIWIALRFGIGPTAWASAIIGVLALVGTASGWWLDRPLGTGFLIDRLTLVGLGLTATSLAALVVALMMRQLRESRALLAATISAIPDPVVVYDRDQRLMLFNDATRTAFPQLGDLLVPGTPAKELRRQGRRRGLIKRTRSARRGAAAGVGDFEVEMFDGRVLQTRARPVEGGGNLVIARDVSGWAERTRRAVWMAEHDALTGLPNRRAFDSRLRTALGETDRRQHPALVLIDLDEFKPINDRHGHPAGDEVLREVGRRLTALVGPSAHVARLGGDEFAILCRLRQPEAELRRLLERLEGTLAAPVDLGGTPVQIGASIGHAMVESDRDTSETLLARADAALYADKRARAAEPPTLRNVVA